MWWCLYIFMYDICMYICINIYTYIDIYIFICIYISVYIYIYHHTGQTKATCLKGSTNCQPKCICNIGKNIWMYKYVYIYMYINMYTYIPIYIHIYVYTYIYIYVYIYIYMYIYICTGFYGVSCATGEVEYQANVGLRSLLIGNPYPHQ
jgi:hypothetical protein